MREITPQHQQALFGLGGRFGLIAHAVANHRFVVLPPEGYGSEVVTVRIPSETRLRAVAFAALAAVPLNRLLNELFQTAIDELEEALHAERPEAYQNFIDIYEIACQQRVEALEALTNTQEN
jgi:non-homologous end joining protein Ku